MRMSNKRWQAGTDSPRGWTAVIGLVVAAGMIVLVLSVPSVHATTAAVLAIDGPIGPVTAMMVGNAIEEAEESGAAVFIIELKISKSPRHSRANRSGRSVTAGAPAESLVRECHRNGQRSSGG